MYINNWNNDYCTCQRCPCCGKIVRPQYKQTWGGGSDIALFGSTTMDCKATSINDPKNAEIKNTLQGLIDTNQLVIS